MAPDLPQDLPEGIPAIGEVIDGKYCVEQVLGVGGMGVVVAAKHLKLDDRVAIKLLLPSLAKNAEVVERFLREARAAVRIKNEHVCRVTDVETLDNGTPYMVMECLDGIDLKALVEQGGPLAPTTAVDYVLQACEAIAEAHALGIVHRDLKPSNLYLTRKPDGEALIKVLDFGIAKVADSGDHSMTKTNVQMGTPYYMAPEQLKSQKDIDARADIWSLGVVLYELLTNSLPFDGESVSALAIAVMMNPVPPIRGVRADVSPALEAAVMRCLEKERDRRPATIAALAELLAPVAGAEGIPSSQRILRGAVGPRRSMVSSPELPPLEPSLAGVQLSQPGSRVPAEKTNGAWQSPPAPTASRSRLWIAIGGAALVGALAAVLAVQLRNAPAEPPPATAATQPPSAAIVTPPPETPPTPAPTATTIASIEPAPVAPEGSAKRRSRSTSKGAPTTTPKQTKHESLPDIH